MNASDATASQTPEKTRVLTGDRPTGRLHLGHYVGSLRSRVALQEDHECFNIVADLHTLTTKPTAADISRLPDRVRELVLDVLAAGVDPDRTVIYLQSGVPAVYDLAILLQMLARTDRLLALDSVRDMARAADVPESAISLGLLAYPVLQAADILMARAEVVPVGPDNIAHVEIARELASHFNEAYGQVFPIPEVRTDYGARLPGLPAHPAPESLPEHGRPKLSKSRGNAIWLSDPSTAVVDKIGALADDSLPAFLDAFIDQAERASVDSATGPARRERLTAAVESVLAPMRERRSELEGQPGLVEELLFDGTVRARAVAYETLGSVREAMGLESLWQGIVREADRRAQQRKKPY